MFKKAFNNWSKKKQISEATEFINGLAVMDSDEISVILVHTLDFRNDILVLGPDLFYPAVILNEEPMFTFKMSSRLKEFQSKGNYATATAMMVWIHTFRAMTELELRPYGRRLWAELSRGFSGVDEARSQIHDMTGKYLNIYGAGQYPDGLHPI